MKNWTDDKIADALQAKSLRIGDDYLVPYGHALKVAQRVRDELMAQLAEARKWVPSTDYSGGTLTIGDRLYVEIRDWGTPDEDSAWAHLLGQADES